MNDCALTAICDALNLKIDANDWPVDEIEVALSALGVILPSGSKVQSGGTVGQTGDSSSFQLLKIRTSMCGIKFGAALCSVDW